MGFSLKSWPYLIFTRAWAVCTSVSFLLCFDAHIELCSWFGSFELWFKSIRGWPWGFLLVFWFFVSLACPKTPFRRNKSRVLRSVFPGSNWSLFRLLFFFRLDAWFHDFIAWNMTKSFTLMLIIPWEICSRSRDSISLIFLWNDGTPQNWFLLPRRRIDSFIHAWTRCNQTPFVISKSFCLADAVFIKVLLSKCVLRIISICSWELIRLSQALLPIFWELSRGILKLTIFIRILPRPRVSCFIWLQMINRRHIWVWSSQHHPLRSMPYMIWLRIVYAPNFLLLLFFVLWPHRKFRTFCYLLSFILPSF